MKTINDYAWTQLNTFDKVPFNSVDSLVFSQLSYIEFDAYFKNQNEKLYFRDFLRTEYFEHLFSNVWDIKRNKDLLFAVAMNPRYRDVKLYKCKSIIDQENDEQFFALTFIIDDKTAYVAFRGTDTSIVGWKEDFNMAFMMPVPAQTHSLMYLNEIGKKFNGLLYVGGHSKGGNLAVYSSVFADNDVKDKIKIIYSHDGPGFTTSLFETKEYNDIKDKINKTIPTQSIVGMLLENQEEYSIVESGQFGILQHDPFSWSVGDNDFVYGENISKATLIINENIKKWLASLSNKEREYFVDTLFHVLESRGIDNFQGFATSWKKELDSIIRSIKSTDTETKKYLLETVKTILTINFNK